MFHKGDRLIRWMVILIVLASAMMGERAPAQAASVTLTTTHDVNLRAGPGVNYDRLAVIPAGTGLTATARDFHSAHFGMSWFQVEYLGLTGWVSAYYVTWSGDYFALHIDNYDPPPGAPTPTDPLPVPAAGDVTVSAARWYTNVRSGPGFSYPIIGTIREDDLMIVSARWGYGNPMWLRITFNGQEAWVAFWAVKLEGEWRTLPDLKPYP